MNNCGLPFEYEYPYLVGPYAKEHKIPVALTLELTPFCNFSCVMCYVRLSEKQARVYGSMMTAEQILDIAEQAKECGTIYLCLTGGEPLSRPDFWDIYKELNKMGFVISLLSNGSLIDEKAIEKGRRSDRFPFFECLHDLCYKRVPDYVFRLEEDGPDALDVFCQFNPFQQA